MIRSIDNSNLDNEKLSQILTPMDNELADFDFSKVIVKKPWGYEYLMYSNDMVSIWVLFIKKGFLTSMHCHIDKQTCLYVLSGEAVCSTLDNGFSLNEGDGLILDRKVFHSTQAISEEGIMIMEVETPSKKTDLLRLSDNYGRQQKGYESKSEMSEDLSNYEHVFFRNDERKAVNRIRNMDLKVDTFDNDLSIQEYFTINRTGTGIILEGSIFDEYKGKTIKAGDMFSFEDVNASGLRTRSDVKILKLSKVSQ